ncbi:hypothetical protein F1188_02645 [Roseospira marina]|uniref:Uncharacterized protein n=2 Tax=Roseospira marina TaxID=140057 RepID=A0A5M6IG32_9PROT|nr:hypothetical protein F1188_02645 [Roseospira marina]
MLPGWVKEQLGFEDAGDTWTAPPPRPDPAGSEPAAFGAERYGIVPPSERPGAPGDTRPLTDRVMGATRGTLAPATGAALILGAPVAPLETGPDAPTPQIQTETVEIHGPQTPGSAGVPGRDGRPAGAAGGPSVTTTVHLTVNGAVEPDALRRTVETAVEDAVRRALEDARDAQAADERASLYD